MRSRAPLEMLELARFMRNAQLHVMTLTPCDDDTAFAFVYHPEIAPLLVAAFDVGKRAEAVIDYVFACHVSDDWAGFVGYAAALGVTIIEGTLQ